LPRNSDTMAPTDKEILNRIERQPNRAAGYKQLIKELGLRGGNDRRELDDRLKRLVGRGELVEVNRDRYALPSAAAGRNVIAGHLSMHRDGYGFVQPESEAVRDKIEGDIYIPAHEIGAAMHGDRVLVEITSTKSDRRAEGRILKIAQRRHRTVVGTFHYGERYNYVEPIDEKVTQVIIIPAGKEIPEAKKREQTTPHRVLGDEARRAAITDLEGVVVDAEITDWPSPTQNPRGRVVEVLGYEDDFGVDVEIIIRKHHLPHVFPDDVLEEAQAIWPHISRQELAPRKDYRTLPIVTIDGETARDFDDAVLVRRLDNGNYELQVHIADVAQYVTPGSALDREARLRGTSVYFPDRAIPMLPLELSTDICSLRPELDRLVLSCVMEIDHSGEIVSYDIHEGVIRSAARMTYTKVFEILNGLIKTRREYAQLVEEFERMRELAEILNRKRVKRGSIDFDLPEPVIEFDDLGVMQGVSRSERNIAHRLIEEFMLAANECVASYLEDRGIPSLYRIHEKPDAKKVFDFETIAATFGYSLGVGALPIKRIQLRGDKRERYGSGRGAKPVEIPEDVHITPRMYQKLTQKIGGKPEERILSYLMLRSLKQARYSEINEGHFALATRTYTHFTSPIRRYPDLIVHRILKEVLNAGPEEYGGMAEAREIRDGHKPSPWSKRNQPESRDGHGPGKRSRESQPAPGRGPIDEDELHQIAEETSQSERRADGAERELIEWKKIRFMQDRIGEDFDALVISVTKYGLFVELNDLFIEGLVPINSLTDDRYTYRENTRQIIGERSGRAYSLGDRVGVILDRIDRAQRKLQFALLEETPMRKRKASRNLAKQKKNQKRRK
jgi:ribonuclease R